MRTLHTKSKVFYFSYGPYDFYRILFIHRDDLSKYNCIDGTFRKITVPAIEVQAQNIDFVGNCFSGRTDSNIVRYSVKNNLPRKKSILFPSYRIEIHRYLRNNAQCLGV
jgi:hypothetical protein